MQPTTNYQIWISGSHRNGIMGYGVVIQPGHIQITGCCAGHCTLEAERMAARTALAQIPAQTTCTVYSSFPPIIPWLRGLTGDDMPVQSVQAEIADMRDVHQQEARLLADWSCPRKP